MLEKQLMAGLPRVHGPRRRLRELLQEKDEPFMLDVYLLERGYSDRLLLLPSRSPCFLCWHSKACKRLQELTSCGFKMLNKLLHRGEAAKKALIWGQYGVPEHSARTNHVSFLEMCSREIPHVQQVHKDEEMSTTGFDLPRKVVHIFNDLLEVAYTPAFYKLIRSKEQLALDCERNAEEKGKHEKIPPKYFISTSTRQLMISDLSCSKPDWSGLQQPQVREIGARIEAEIFESIKEETILEMIGYHCIFMKSSKLF